MSTGSAKVYFTDFRVHTGTNLLDKLEQLATAAGIKSLPLKGAFVAIKIHFGEPGNLAYLRPNYAARIVRMVKEAGGIPFLTDANTLYKGRRDNAVHHLESAWEHGFSPATVGCPVIIADGLRGTEYREIGVDGKQVKLAKIASAIADADIVISLNHFKGHEMTGFGGALKNLGMGSGSVGGKLEMHCTSKPQISESRCVGCRACVENCRHGAAQMNDKHKAFIETSRCVGCGQCIVACRYGAAHPVWDAGIGDLEERIAEYALAVCKGKPHFHINFLMDISPNCDCFGTNDIPLVPNIGMLASLDPVAIDQASVDLVNRTPVNALSCIGQIEPPPIDKFKACHPKVDWLTTLVHAEKMGLGVQAYELVECAEGTSR